MLMCEQVSCFLQQILHNVRVARTTENSDFDRFVHLVVYFPSWTFLLSLFRKFDFTGIADSARRRSPFAMNFIEIILSSAWVKIRCFGDYHRIISFLWSAPSLFRVP